MGLPKYLKKSYSREDLINRVLKKVQLKHDREFLATLFKKDGEGNYALKPDLSKEEKSRLKKITKEIKQGRGGIRILPLVIVGVIVAAAVVFSLFFKDPLADRLMERYLGELNGATVDVDGLHVSLLDLEIRWDRLQITDGDNLDRNMVELGETVLRMNSLALLEKKIVADSLVSRNAAWDRARETPGVLIIPDDKKEEKGEEDSGPTLGERLSTDRTDRIAGAVSDPGAFVDEQWDSLKTPALAEELKESYGKALGDRKASAAALKDETGAIVKEGQAFLERDYGSYRSHPDRIPSLLSEVDDYFGRIDRGRRDLQAELKAVQELKASLIKDRKALEAARDEDMARVKSLISLPEGGVKGLINDMVQSYLASLLGDKYARIKKIAAFARKYRKEGPGRGEEKGGAGRSGRVVPFDRLVWPDLFLREALVSAEGSGFSWEASLKELAADPDQWDAPSTLGFQWKQDPGSLEGSGVLDRRSEGDPSGGSFTFAGLPFTTDALSGMGISRAGGNGEGTADLTVDREGNWALTASLTVADPGLEKSGDDLAANVLYRVLSGEDWHMTLSASGRGDDVSFSLDWPLLDRVDDEIGAVLKEQAAEFLDGVEKELLERYAGELGFLDDYLGDLDVSEALLKGDLSSLDSSKKRVSEKMDQVQKDATDQAAKEAADAVKDAAKSLPKLF